VNFQKILFGDWGIHHIFLKAMIFGDTQKIEIDPGLLQRVPEINLKCISASLKIEKSGNELNNMLDVCIASHRQYWKLENLSSRPAIRETRQAIKACGKDPSRYRPAAEALMRRILKGENLYRINNAVDINNLLSLESGYSIGVYDLEKLTPPITFTIGSAEMDYEGIGRGKINVAGLPVFCDALGPFASPVTDTPRSQVTLDTQKILFNIIGFRQSPELDSTADRAIQLLCKLAGATIH